MDREASPRPSDTALGAADAFLDAFSAASSGPPATPALQALFISAVVDCAGPVQVCRFLRRVAVTLVATGPFEDTQLEQWRWLLLELRLMEELDTKRFGDARVRAALAQLEARVESRNDPTVFIDLDGADQQENLASVADQDAVVSWDAMAKSLRDSSRQTLRRLLSGSGSAPETRDSLGSVDFPSHASDGSRRSRQYHAQAAQSDVGNIAILQRNSSDSVSSMLWSISSKIGIMNVEETFLCQICFENVSVEDAAELSQCKHRFCHPCIKTYLELKVVDGQVYPVCFHETETPARTNESNTSLETDTEQPLPPPPPRKACGTPIAPWDIEASVSSDVWKKYLMFKFNKENEYGRQCPYCEASHLCAGPEHPECICAACGKPFCFTHGKAHADGTCADFEMRQAEAEKLNRSAIAEISKPCPGCKSNVEKSGGCNHMKCIVCNTDFCWICGAVVDSNVAPFHFQWWNVRGCAGLQMEDVDAQTPSERFWMGLVRIFMVVFLGPPAFLITIALTLVSCCCVPCMAMLQLSFRDLFTSCLNFVVICLLFTLTGICMAVTFVCAIVWEVISSPFQFLHSRCCPRATPTETPAASASNGVENSAA